METPNEAPDPTPSGTPTLISVAAGVYARSIRLQLEAFGFDDVPRNGALVLAAAAAVGGTANVSASQLGMSKQALIDLIERLVDRGYLERVPAPGQPSGSSVRLTDRGEEAAHVATTAVEVVDGELSARVSAAEIEAMRISLMALSEITAPRPRSVAGRTRQHRHPGGLRQFSPIFPVRDLDVALAHYETLGFVTRAYDAGYGFADRDGLSLHLATDPRHDPSDGGSAAYLSVEDADALYARWSRPSITGTTTPVELTPWGMKEGSHVDLDGNVIRFGSPQADG